MGVDGQIEKEINLSIALKLDTMLRAYGFETILTRNSDVSIHSADAKTVRQQKSSDLKNRLKLLEDTSSGILISIHQNKYSQSSACGTQVFYGRNCPESKELAEMLQKQLPVIFSLKINEKSNRQQKIFISCIRLQNPPLWWNAAFCPMRQKQRSSPTESIRIRLHFRSAWLS